MCGGGAEKEAGTWGLEVDSWGRLQGSPSCGGQHRQMHQNVILQEVGQPPGEGAGGGFQGALTEEEVGRVGDRGNWQLDRKELDCKRFVETHSSYSKHDSAKGLGPNRQSDVKVAADWWWCGGEGTPVAVTVAGVE